MHSSANHWRTSSLKITQHSEPSIDAVPEGIPEEVIDFEFVDDPYFESDDDNDDAPFSDHSTDNEEDWCDVMMTNIAAIYQFWIGF